MIKRLQIRSLLSDRGYVLLLILMLLLVAVVAVLTALYVRPGELRIPVRYSRFDSKNYTVFNESEKISLTQREAELLKLFIDNKNKVLKREEILKALWGEDDYFMGRSLDVFISRLRKIFINETGIAIENLHGIGFKFSIE